MIKVEARGSNLKPLALSAPKTPMERCQRVVHVALPFIPIYSKSLSGPASIIKEAPRIVSALSSLVKNYQAGDKKRVGIGMLETAASIAAIAEGFSKNSFTVPAKAAFYMSSSAANLFQALSKEEYGKAAEQFAKVVGNIVFLGVFFLGFATAAAKAGAFMTVSGVNFFHALRKEEYDKAAEQLAKVVGSALFLGAFFSGSAPLLVFASSARILITVYDASKHFKKEEHLESAGDILMSAVRTRRLYAQ